MTFHPVCFWNIRYNLCYNRVMKITLIFTTLFTLILTGLWAGSRYFDIKYFSLSSSITPTPSNEDLGGLEPEPHPLSIEALRVVETPGSDLRVIETLAPGSNYTRQVVSYRSDEFTQYALLTIPTTTAPEGGFPVIVFNHGYIPPSEYRTTERYQAYTDVFSQNGYILIRPDYRGHGNSEGEARGGYGNNDYTIDVLNAVASVSRLPQANPDRIGMWGHSMGGHITLRAMVVNPQIKAGVIWAGVVAPYPDLINNWRRSNRPTPSPFSGARRWRDQLTSEFGSPESNPEFWNQLSAHSYLDQLSGPIQLHHGTLDTSVPFEFSQNLAAMLENVQSESELYLYQGDDHNLSVSFGTAASRSVTFFNTHL